MKHWSILLCFVLVCGLAVHAVPVRAQSIWVPPPSQSWDWQLSEPFDFTRPVDIIDIDQQETSAQTVAMLHAQGKRVICYISVGSWESWRPDASSYAAALKGKNYDGWAGEKWVDIRRIDLLGPILLARFDDCAAKGFDGIEPDNIAGFEENTGFALTAADQLTFNRWLAEQAHSRGLSIGLKNDNGQVAELVGDFDWALTEDCDDQGWCADLNPFIAAGKAVLQAEYTDNNSTLSGICGPAKARGFSAILKERDLHEWARFCPADSSIAASTLPVARSFAADQAVTVFASIINAHTTQTAENCSIALPAGLAATLSYQTTNPATNAPTGTPDMPVNIQPGQSQSFVLSITPDNALITGTDIYLVFDCANTVPAAHLLGTNTVHLSPNATGGSADLIANLATTSNDGIVHLPSNSGSHFFTASAINIGQSGTITANVSDDGAALPLAITLCMTDETGACLAPASTSVQSVITNNQTVFYAVFVTATGPITFDPALHRLTLRLVDSSGDLRGATSVAVRTP